MLFNSDVFVLGFLPAVLLTFRALTLARSERATLILLILASFLFYGWWDWHYVFLLAGSVLFNFAWAAALRSRHARVANRRRMLLALGVAANLTALGYFKYTRFLAETLAGLGVWQAPMPQIVLPLAISFFTFEQIAYLVDTFRGRVPAHGFLQYAAFIVFFPRLIAGPIVRPHEVLPQLRVASLCRFDADHVSTGLFIFSFGLAKKVLLADTFGAWAAPLFDSVPMVSFNDAWGAANAFVLQVYFDFSGYSDMAVGLALVFNIRLPENFVSPYQATSLIDFWRRWHMTLSRFLRDYVYIPLGGNRHGPAREYASLMATLTLGGLWHGANWTFVVFGAAQGLGLVLNHAWRRTRSPVPAASGWALTFAFIVVTFVLFRAPSFERAEVVYTGMLGLNGLTLERAAHTIGGNRWKWLLAGLGIVLLCPNRQQIIAWPWRSPIAYGATFATLMVVSLLALGDGAPFVYFQF